MNMQAPDIIEHIHSTARPARRRYGLLHIILIGILLVIGCRGAYLKILQGPSFRAKAEHNRVDSIILPAPRGVIYDRNRTQLVENISSTDLVFKPNHLPSVANESWNISGVISGSQIFIQPIACTRSWIHESCNSKTTKR